MTRSIRRVLVANRGEIAVRVMRTCRDLGIETVAVYSEADRLSAHVLAADHAVAIGAAPAAESYLRVERIIDACRTTGADAVHPGYGFLSENAQFAAALADAGITFIGPKPHAIEVMGSKTKARALMKEVGVPLVPGDAGPDGNGFPSSDAALEAARRIGFPVLLKAAAGGGGKGMRLVASEEGFRAAFEGAEREAIAAFGDGTVYVEKAVVNPRHIEVQVFADTKGNVVHLGERDCSIQRRHQKVVEEAPSPVIGDDKRRALGEAAIRAAAACDYVGAGTVEFLFDGSDFYFLEMNTRLQVEHPVTEMIYGVDLVEWQIRVAEGAALPMSQAELDQRRRGSAIECRIYAEDHQRFMPSPGEITVLRTPAGPYVRDDSGVYQGWVVPVHYDPLLSKLVTWGETRDQALARMRRALHEYRLGGIRSNLLLHRRILANDEFCAGSYDTGFIPKHSESLAAPDTGSDDEVRAAIAAAIVERGSAAPVIAESQISTQSQWRGGGGWRRRVF